MGGSFYLGGGKTGMARRLAMDEPSLTLTCSPAQKQTERCHPIETRPLTVREYARIQTFPDDWQFAGTLSAQYKQIGNAVPVNLAWAVGRSIIRLLNQIEKVEHGETLVNKEMKEAHEHDVHYYTPQGEVVQLSLFESQALYLSQSDPTLLLGSCRQGTREWITSHLMYNYPITPEELTAHPELIQVKRLAVLHRKTLVGYFNVTGVKMVNLSYLQEYGYPVKSSRHKLSTQYLLYTLEGNTDKWLDLNLNDFKLVIGKGIKKQ